MKRALLAAILALGFAAEATADVRLPSIFSDHMVVQADEPLRLWGWATPGERVSARFDGRPAMSLEEVGDKIGVTRERARQIVQQALRKLRHPRHTRRLRGYLS